LICEMCGNANTSLMKIPCGYYIDHWEGKILFTMPNDEEAYRNICLECILGEKETTT
jgi:hypothetical protein